MMNISPEHYTDCLSSNSGLCSLYTSSYTEPTCEQRQQLFACPLQATTTEQSHLSSSGNKEF